MKFVPKDPGPAADNSSGGGVEGFIKEAGMMLAAHWALGILLSLLFALIMGGLFLILAWLSG